MKLIVTLTALLFLFQACGNKEEFKEQKPVIREELDMRHFDYDLDNDLNIPVEYHEFDTLDLSVDMA
jgi:hypothetical protein